MAAMTTVLTEFSNNGNSRTSVIAGHTAIKPQLVIEKRKIPEGKSQIVEYVIKVVLATVDSDSVVLQSKVSFEATVRYPILGSSADVTRALAVFADIISGDEFANSVQTQEWL